MKRDELIEYLEEYPVIAAVKEEAGLGAALACSAKVIFVLYGSVMDITAITKKIKAAGKAAMVHIDLIDGLAPREAAVDFIAGQTVADGILSTKPPLVKRAREQGLIGIRRVFLLDSMALHTLNRQIAPGDADLIEVLPGVMPKVLRGIVQKIKIPLIAGGLINDKEDVVNALSAGTIAISTTNPAIWEL